VSVKGASKWLRRHERWLLKDVGNRKGWTYRGLLMKMLFVAQRVMLPESP